MERRLLGGTGREVSRIALGCGNFGGIGSAPAFFGMGEDEAAAFELMDAAVALGVTLFDTADAYGGGRSERTIGRWLAERTDEAADVVVATKVFHSVAGDANDRGLARERILRQVEGSLERLGRERIDLYLIHEPDPDTSLEETLAALDALIRAGKVGAIGASNVDAAWLADALALSDRLGLARFEWVQNSYSLLDLGDEDELLPLCGEHGIGYTPFGPLAGGWLTGKYGRDRPFPEGSRMTLRPEPYAHLLDERVYTALDRLDAAANARGTSMAALSLAWVLSHPVVSAVVVGPRRPAHLDPAHDALELSLTAAERAELTELFR